MEVSLEITKEPSKIIGKDDKLNVDLSILLDPEEENPMQVDVQAKVENNYMDLHAVAVSEGEGQADVRAEIHQGAAEDKGQVQLEVVETDMDKKKMKLKAKKEKKKSKQFSKAAEISSSF